MVAQHLLIPSPYPAIQRPVPVDHPAVRKNRSTPTQCHLLSCPNVFRGRLFHKASAAAASAASAASHPEAHPPYSSLCCAQHSDPPSVQLKSCAHGRDRGLVSQDIKPRAFLLILSLFQCHIIHSSRGASPRKNIYLFPKSDIMIKNNFIVSIILKTECSTIYNT